MEPDTPDANRGHAAHSARVCATVGSTDRSRGRYTQDGVPRPRPLTPPGAGRLNEINVPTLVVTGALDMRAIRQQGEFIHAGIRGSESVVIAGAGHMVNMERPEEFDRAERDFLGRVGDRAV